MSLRHTGLTRRAALKLAGASAVLAALRPFAWAAGKSNLHGLSVFGDLKYPDGFTQFDYINAQAPKGGRINFQPPYWVYNQSPNTFNTLNSFVLRGDSPPRIELLFDTLLSSAADEPDSMYGLIAESVAVSEDGNVYTFTVRDGAHFHDGSRLTASDVAFSLMLLKDKGHPNIAQVVSPMVKAEATGPKTVVVSLSGKQDRSTILTIAGLPIFSKAYYSAQEFDASSLKPPLGSGAYRVGRIEAGRFIEYERVEDYWARDLPVNVGFNNFEVIRIDFFQEREPAFEAFKKGEITYHEEFTSKIWATGYDFPAFTAGKVKKAEFDEELKPDLQGWFFNQRRRKFANPRTRQAIALAFDFEWTNRNLFYDSYTRQVSFFQKSDFMAEGVPGEDELKLLEPFRSELPPEVFGEVYMPPKSDGSGRDRTLLRQASNLLQAAGWKADGTRLVNQEGERLTVEFLIDAQVFQKVLGSYIGNLRLIGVEATIRQVDPAQYQQRTANFDFDVVMDRHSMSATPLDGLQQFFGSKAADTPGSYNYSGIKDKAIDALLDRLPAVSSRAELIAVTRAMDRILRARQIWVPNWVLTKHRVAHWDVFAWPAKKPAYGFTPETTWWFDRERAVEIGMAG